jgi:dTDP-4-dehydrorhamnose reductase
MRVLILGGNGMLGHKLCNLLPEELEVWATFRTPPQQYSILPFDRQIHHVSVIDVHLVKELLDRLLPDAVVNAVGIVKQRDEAKNVVKSIQVNALFPHLLADLCIERNIRVIQFSTDCVFSGARGNYSEMEIPDPVDLYGRSKLLGEVNKPGILTLRTSIIGWQLNTFTSLLSWFALQRGKRIKGYRRAIYSGLSTSVLAQLIEKILLAYPDLSGIYNVASKPISKYELLLELRELLDWKDISIEPDENYICDRSLSAGLFTSHTGWNAPAWEFMLKGIAAEWPYYQEYYLAYR